MVAGRAIKSLLKDFPDIEVDKVEFLTNRKTARDDGVRKVPALVYGDRVLTGVLLTKGKIRSFFEAVQATGT